MNEDKIEELALYMLSRLPARYDAQEGSVFHDLLRVVAVGIEYALQQDEKSLADKVYKSLKRKQSIYGRL